MKRGKQIVIFLLVLILCGGYAFWRSGLHLSPEAAMHAEEQGLRYGPSDEILLTYEKENGDFVYVGRWEKGLSVVGVEPVWGIFWKAADLQSGFSRCLPITEDMEAFLIDEGYIVGLSKLPEVKKVTCYLNTYHEELREDIFVQEVTMEVAENGFFFSKVRVLENENWDTYRIGYLEGSTASGEVVFQYGEKKKSVVSSDGYSIKDLEAES